MKVALQTNGNTWHLYLNKTIVKFLGITENERTVLLTLENDVLYVKKLNDKELEKYKDYLCKKLVKRGTGYGLNFPLSLLDLLNINPETDFIDYSVNGQVLIIKKSNN